jgi:hypothetical protein
VFTRFARTTCCTVFPSACFLVPNCSRLAHDWLALHLKAASGKAVVGSRFSVLGSRFSVCLLKENDLCGAE